MQVTAVLIPAEEGGYVALNPETGTTTQGDTVEDALANLAEAVDLYLDDAAPIALRSPAIVTTVTVQEHA